MTLMRDVLAELLAMFWADRRLNLSLLAVTALAGVVSLVVPGLRHGVLPVLLTCGCGAAFLWALLPGKSGM